MTEPEHKRRTRALMTELNHATDAADVALRRCLVLMTALGFRVDETIPITGALACLERVARTHERQGDIVEIVEGVLP